MATLARAMVMDRTTLIRVTRPLLERGLISSDSCGHAKRRLQLALTESGRAKLEEAMPYWRAAQNEFESRYGTRQADVLRRELFFVTGDSGEIKASS
jgi:DNA-binding MarR family transcriptional regulator